MVETNKIVIGISLLVGGVFLLAISLMVWDELTTLQLYVRTCSDYWSEKCFPGYPFPVGPVLYGYTPEEVVWGMLLISMILANVRTALISRFIRENVNPRDSSTVIRGKKRKQKTVKGGIN